MINYIVKQQILSVILISVKYKIIEHFVAELFSIALCVQFSEKIK